MTLKITQASSGSIAGTIQDLTFGQQPQPIKGFYSPVARRLVFLRSASGTPTHVYEASVSVDGNSLSGSFKTLNASGGASSNGIDFNFSASKSQ